jgi:hypothetical protein
MRLAGRRHKTGSAPRNRLVSLPQDIATITPVGRLMVYTNLNAPPNKPMEPMEPTRPRLIGRAFGDVSDHRCCPRPFQYQAKYWAAP